MKFYIENKILTFKDIEDKDIFKDEEVMYFTNNIIREKEVEKVILPDGVTEIPKLTFSDCYTLREIKIPDSVKIIGDEAFIGCTDLCKINIPYGCSIGKAIFKGCEYLFK